MSDLRGEIYNNHKEKKDIELSHKIRTQASNVTGFLELLKVSNLNDEQSEYVSRLQIALVGLFKTFKENTDILEVEYGEYQNLNVQFDIRNEINDAINVFREKSSKKNIKMNVDFSSNLPQLVNGERFISRYLLTDILTKIIEKSNDCSMNLNVFEFKESKKGLEIMFNIQTDSKYIEVSILDKMLRQKYTNFNLYTTNFNLYTNKKIGYQSFDYSDNLINENEAIPITLMENGYFDISFSYIFEKVTKREVFDKKYQGMKILSVDDDPINQKIISNLMKKFNVKCDIVENGKEAIDAYDDNNYDLIFMDCQMPVMDGYDATGKIREKEKGTHKHTPIVAITACAMEGDREKCIESGMDYYLTKPVNVKHIEGILIKYSKLNSLKI